MSIGSDVEVGAVGAHPAVVRDILGSAHVLTFLIDILDDIRPIDANGKQVVVDLNDIVWRVAEFFVIYGTEPLVGESASCGIVERQLPIVALPVTFVADDKIVFNFIRLSHGATAT